MNFELNIPKTNLISDLQHAASTLEEDKKGYKRRALVGAGLTAGGIAGTIKTFGSDAYNSAPELAARLKDVYNGQKPLGPQSFRTAARLGLPLGIGYAIYNKDNKKDVALGAGTALGSLGYLVATNPKLYQKAANPTSWGQIASKAGKAALPILSLAALGYTMNNLSKMRTEEGSTAPNRLYRKFPFIRYIPGADNIASKL